MPHSASSGRPPLELKSAIIKRSIELNGHKTSVSLEDEFWLSLRQIATSTNTGLPALLQTIDTSREGANLSSAIRVYVLNHYRNDHTHLPEHPYDEGTQRNWAIPRDTLDRVRGGVTLGLVAEHIVRELLDWYMPWHEQVYLPWAEGRA